MRQSRVTVYKKQKFPIVTLCPEIYDKNIQKKMQKKTRLGTQYLPYIAFYNSDKCLHCTSLSNPGGLFEN